jgi:hypothetical protein
MELDLQICKRANRRRFASASTHSQDAQTGGRAIVPVVLPFLLFLYDIISQRHRVFPRKSWAVSGSGIGKTAGSHAVFALFPLFS